MTDGVCRVAAVQLRSGDDTARNLETIAEVAGQAAADGCRLVYLPENCAHFAASDAGRAAAAETPGAGPIQDALARLARQLDVEIVAGSLPLVKPGDARVYAASVVFGADGAVRAVYRKLHLFDVDVPDSGESYRESAYHAPGDEPVLADTRAGRLGLSICYDLRFPELYRRLGAAGATLYGVPSAFTEATGRAHWHTLLRARAIENLAWVVAPAQQGSHPNGRRTFGHTLIVDPWGRIAAERAEGVGFVAADLDHLETARLRRAFPALDHRRLDAPQDERTRT